MSEKTNSFNKSFNEEFCTCLESYLSDVFAFAEPNKFKRYWCDGVSHAPFYNDEVNREYLSIERVLKDKEILTTAYLGENGQDRYEMTLVLGDQALSKYSKGLSLKSCLPSKKSMDWIQLNSEPKKIKLFLK